MGDKSRSKRLIKLEGCCYYQSNDGSGLKLGWWGSDKNWSESVSIMQVTSKTFTNRFDNAVLCKVWEP